MKFEPGDKALLTDRRGRRYLLTLRPGASFHFHRGIVEDLERFNPYVNPATIRPGQRLKLRATPPKVKKRGPIFHKVREGDSFGSIAFRWDTSVPRLKRLNPRFEDAPMKPGDNVRLRRK